VSAAAALTVLTVFPRLFNVNGDAENALVLAQRSRWSGHSARIVAVEADDAFPAVAPSIVVIGSTTDVQLPRAITALRSARDRLAEWIAAGVPVLAVGTGLELLSEGIELGEPDRLDGLGLVPGRAVTAATRVSNDLVVSSPYGRLIGYENHARDFVLPEGVDPLGDVLFGRGNGADASSAPLTEGLRFESVIGTHLHGPVLAKNPALADHLLTLALGDGYDSRTVPGGRVDDIARAARNTIAARLELTLE
jgi:CobQ-like glutamine amidotransferase family enzyme